MQKRKVFILGGVLLWVLGGALLHAAESQPESTTAYRKATLETLIAESRKERNFARRGTGQYSKYRSAYFRLGKDSSLTLEPVNASIGDVVGA